MKINTLKISVISTVLLGIPLMSTAFASEITGTLNTGLSSTVSVVEGVVIAPPAVLPVAGTYTSAQSIILTAPGSTSIRYTLDGSTPSCSVGTLYTGAISVGITETINAISCYAQKNSSTVASYLYTINIPVSIVGGGGGGGGINVVSSNNQPQSQSFQSPVIQTASVVPIEVNNNQNSKGMVLGASVFNFQKNLRLGMQNVDVKEMQKILIADGFLKSTATGYFGLMTKSALIKWQANNGLPATGYFGPMTRALFQKTLG